MHEPSCEHKPAPKPRGAAVAERAATTSLQLLFTFAYAAAPNRHAAPAADQSSYQDALVARVRRAFAGATPYAVSLAARTDAGVAALHNVCSLRLRLDRAAAAPERVRSALLAVAAEANDGLRAVRGWSLARRTLIRASAATKHYAYTLAPPANAHAAAWPPDGPAAAQKLVAEFCRANHFHRYCEAKAAQADKATKPRPPCQVQLVPLSTGGALLLVASTALLRHQVRHMAAAVRQVLEAPEQLPSFVAALRPPSGPYAGPVTRPAPAAGLTLRWVELPAHLLGTA